LKYVSEEQRDWDLYLDAILFLYRVSTQDSTKMSPFLLVYGRQPQLPVEFSINSTLENGDEDEKDGGSQEQKSPVDENEDSGSYKGNKNEKDSGSQEGDENEKDSGSHEDEDEKDSGSQEDNEDEKDSGSQEGHENEDIGSQEENEDEKDSGGHEGDENEKDDNGGQEDKNSTDKDKKDDGKQEEGIGLEEHICKMVTIRRKALENIKVVHYDANIARTRLGTRWEHWFLNSLKLSPKGSKMAPNWLGPYCIHEVLNKGTFRLSQVKDGKKVLAQLYNMTRLKLYYHREHSDQITDDNPPNKRPQTPSSIHQNKRPQTPSSIHENKRPQTPSQIHQNDYPQTPIISTKTSAPKLPVKSTKTSTPKLPVKSTKKRNAQTPSQIHQNKRPQTPSQSHQNKHPQTPSQSHQNKHPQTPSPIHWSKPANAAEGATQRSAG